MIPWGHFWQPVAAFCTWTSVFLFDFPWWTPVVVGGLLGTKKLRMPGGNQAYGVWEINAPT